MSERYDQRQFPGSTGTEDPNEGFLPGGVRCHVLSGFETDASGNVVLSCPILRELTPRDLQNGTSGTIIMGGDDASGIEVAEGLFRMVSDTPGRDPEDEHPRIYTGLTNEQIENMLSGWRETGMNEFVVSLPLASAGLELVGAQNRQHIFVDILGSGLPPQPTLVWDPLDDVRINPTWYSTAGQEDGQTGYNLVANAFNSFGSLERWQSMHRARRAFRNCFLFFEDPRPHLQRWPHDAMYAMLLINHAPFRKGQVFSVRAADGDPGAPGPVRTINLMEGVTLEDGTPYPSYLARTGGYYQLLEIPEISNVLQVKTLDYMSRHFPGAVG